MRANRPVLGNQTVQRQTLSGFSSAAAALGLGGAAPRLEVGSESDPAERSADAMAELALSGPVHAEPGGCQCGGACPACRAAANLARRSPAPAPSHVPALLGSSGSPLNGPVKERMESRFGASLGGVRVHTGKAATASARTLGAKAFAHGNDVVFDEAAERPGTAAGDRLLAHELAHVVQGSGSQKARRVVPGDVTQMSITPWWAAALTDGELREQIFVLKRHIETLPVVTLEYQTALDNLEVLEAESSRRFTEQSGVSIDPGSSVDRPAGLPDSDGYVLHPLEGLPDGFADLLPEGQIVTLDGSFFAQADLARGVEGGDAPSFQIYSEDLLPGLGGGAAAGLSGFNSALMNYGLAAAGPNSIGIVAIPPANWKVSPFSEFNPIDFGKPLTRAGHTAVIVRQGGKITVVRGFNPQMNTIGSFADVAVNQGEIFTGQRGVQASITNDASLFKSTNVRTLEYPVSAETAKLFAEGLPETGLVPEGGPLYTAPPSNYAPNAGGVPGCKGTNCGLWAAQQVEGELGGRIGAQGKTPVMDIGPGGTEVPGMARQGKVVEFLRDVKAGEPVAPMPNATGPAVAGELSTGLKVLKWGGRVLLVVGVATTIWDIVSAPEGQKGKAAAKGIGGFLGGLAAGAALGLACGPAAPVCCIVTGIVGGIVGAIAGSSIGEAIYDWFTAPPPPPMPWYGPRMVDHNGIVCPDCHSLSQPLGTYDARKTFQFDDSLMNQAPRMGQFGPPVNKELSPAEIDLITRWLTEKPQPSVR